jgi:hypothetical protein
MDCILCFKVGKFYEIFHMDADAAVAALPGQLAYMKGASAHVGFPEIAFHKFSASLVARGFRVARAEQTETPAMLKERNAARRLARKERRQNARREDRKIAHRFGSVVTQSCAEYIVDIAGLERDRHVTACQARRLPLRSPVAIGFACRHAVDLFPKAATELIALCSEVLVAVAQTAKDPKKEICKT